MKKNKYAAFSIQFFILFFALLVPLTSAQTFVVTELDDPAPDGCNSGVDCSLREAIIAANDAGSGTVTIQLVGGETYTLSIVNADASTTDFDSPDETEGSLKILNTVATVRIEATGSGMATIDANEIDRVFILYPGTDVEIDEIEVTGGKPNGSSTAGGIMVIKNENLVITNSTITGNSAGDGNSYGAGMWIEGSTVAITGSTISNNTAGFQGGGIRITRYNEEVTVNSDVTIENSTISNNDGGSYGGGIYSERADLTIIESTISQNQATGFGGGINISTSTLNDRKITIDRTTIDENLGGLGGGLDIGGGDVLIINSTISGNEADNFNGAGGIYAGNFSDAIIDIVNTTITNNTSGNIGGVINGSGGAVINFSNSIVANQDNNDDDCSGTMTSKGNNLSSDETCGFTETGDLQNSDPLLGALQDNGGPVFTHAITGPLSPAVNNGSNTLYTSEGGGDLANDTDASGNDRVYDFASGGIIDIGSFELQQDATFDGCPVTNEDKILFVKKGESGTGANWGDALGELRDVLALFEDETCSTEDVEEIWVTAGTYLPTDDSGDRVATFNMIEGLDIYGGFVGSEDREIDRDLESNISILSGDINEDNNLSGNSYHVVSSIDNTFGNLSDFTITGGNANGTAPHDKGGGFYANNGGTGMNAILFQDNYAETAGGGAYVEEDGTRPHFNQPQFFNSIFTNNSTGEDGNGGGLALIKTETRITTSIFENNEADNFGGGLYNDGSDPVIKNTIFRENSAGSEGGGILNHNSDPELFNVLITGNDAFLNGGGIVNGPLSDPMLTNVTISGNEALGHSGSDGGGMYNRNNANPILLNTIVWGNMAGGTGNEILNSSNSTAVLNFSLYGNDTGDIVEGGGFTANNSTTSQPNFTDNSSGDFTLLGTSPAINTGDPDTEMSDFNMLAGFDEIDLAKNPRVFNGTTDIIDMGAYEFQGEPVAPSSCPATDNILYVKKGESGTGASWDNALGELRDVYALFDSEDCTTDDVDEIWVAAGTYLPTDNSSDRIASFSVINDIDLFGGFEGVNSETSLEDRDWETNVTVLSGDIDEGSDLDGNSYHVVEAVEIDTETMLDGFTISGGNADLVDANNNFIGGGLYVNNSILTVINTIFENNFAEFGGGGAFVDDSDRLVIFSNVHFNENESDFGGGLMSQNSSPKITDSVFSSNIANWGGGFRALGGSPVIEETTFSGNVGNSSGGAISLNAGTAAKSISNASAVPGDMVLITNSVISGNESTDESGGGGGIINEGSHLILRNVLISGNSSDGFGGGIEFIETETALIINSTITGNQTQKLGGGIQITEESSPTIQNSIVWNNDSIDEDYERADNFSIGTGTPVISFSMIEGCKPGGTWDEFCGTDGGNNFADTDPLFDTGITPGDSPTTDGDFTLTSASPVINIGDNTLYNNSGGDIDNDLDLAEQSRLFDGTTDVIDLGAYEFQGEPDSEEPEFAPFITTWKVEEGDLSITFRTSDHIYTYDYDVDWGDGKSDTGVTGNGSHIYDAPGTYTVKISGEFPAMNYTGDYLADKLMTVEQWGDIEWIEMYEAFFKASSLEVNATDTPDLSNVKSLRRMFHGASSMTGAGANWEWDTSNITNMGGMFSGAGLFNQDISSWNTSNVVIMQGMFNKASSFNQDIGYDPDTEEGWDVSSVIDMGGMFGFTDAFNQDISGWDVSSVTDMLAMFLEADAFNQNLGDWDISMVETMTRMLDGSGLSTANYDATLTGWAGQTVQSEVELGADGLTYCEAEADRQSLLTDDSWDILGDDLAESCGEFRPFITTWKTDNPGDSDDQSIRIPMIGNGYDFNVDWGDGNDEDYNTNPGDDITHFIEHTYASAGEYEVKITGDFSRIFLNNEGDKEKLLTIEQWGEVAWTSMNSAFMGSTNLTYNATDVPDLSAVTDMGDMFFGASSFNGDLNGWDVSGVTNMESVFQRARSFTGDLNSWDVSSVETMKQMFHDADTFNGDISSWNVGNVTSMRGMFRDATSFNGDIGDWDVSSVTDMFVMFDGAFSFNQDLSNWNVSNVESMSQMLKDSGLSTENYDATLTGWAGQTVQNGLTLGANGLTYCEAEDDRQSLIEDHNWSIIDAGLAGGCTSPEGEDQRIFVSNAEDYEFSGDDFGVSNAAFSILIESLPDEGNLEFEGNPVSVNDEISVGDINSDKLTWDPPSNEYGYNFTSFTFKIVDVEENDSEDTFTMTIDLGTVYTELTGSEGWRFMTNPSDGDSYFDLFSEMTVELDFPTRQSLYELDQPNYAWDPVGSTGDEPGVGTPFIIYVLEDDLPDLPLTVQSGDNWNDLDGSYSYTELDYDAEGTSPNPGNFYLVGNPHPIALDLCEMFDSASSQMADNISVWDPAANGSNGDYIMLSCSTGLVRVPPFHSFWVRTTGENPVLSVPQSSYLSGPEDGYLKQQPDQQELPLISITVSHKERPFASTTQVLFSDQATGALDRFDAPKLSPEGLAKRWLSFHSVGEQGRSYALQSLPESLLQVQQEPVRIPLHVEGTESGHFNLNWTLPESHLFGGSYYLRDNQSGEVMELIEGSRYSFEIAEQQTAKVNTDERSAKSLTDFADLGEDSSPRFELLIAGTGIDGFTELGAVPETFILDQNYPNPFNPTTVINYQLPASSQVRLEVYDMLGRNVATLVNGQVAAGRHTVNFDAANLSSGVYLYRLVAGSQIITRKLTILK